MTPPFKISSDIGLADTLNGRCEAMTLPQYDGDLPPYRCTREAGTDRKGRRVCEVHSRPLQRVTFYDAMPSRSSARIVSFREGMRSSQDYFWLFDLEGRGDDHFPSPINNGRFIEMPVEVRFGRSPG
jgi:hypothetical protein